ncbi:hypothetical protein, partial [Ligilactobacillus ruminis]|uniref:hypothetical protein n=1 Tax=Ligilactobacillus ruminis TaxID=1623 RepID=UPI0022E0CBB2
ALQAYSEFFSSVYLKGIITMTMFGISFNSREKWDFFQIYRLYYMICQGRIQIVVLWQFKIV